MGTIMPQMYNLYIRPGRWVRLRWFSPSREIGDLDGPEPIEYVEGCFEERTGIVEGISFSRNADGTVDHHHVHLEDDPTPYPLAYVTEQKVVTRAPKGSGKEGHASSSAGNA